MGAYVIRRLLISIPVLLGITLLGFLALKLSPGDPLLASTNPEVLAQLAAHPEILEQERKRLGFDQPVFPNQYIRWLGNVLQGDDYFPQTKDAGKQSAQVFKSSAAGGSESMAGRGSANGVSR